MRHSIFSGCCSVTNDVVHLILYPGKYKQIISYWIFYKNVQGYLRFAYILSPHPTVMSSLCVPQIFEFKGEIQKQNWFSKKNTCSLWDGEERLIWFDFFLNAFLHQNKGVEFSIQFYTISDQFSSAQFSSIETRWVGDFCCCCFNQKVENFYRGLFGVLNNEDRDRTKHVCACSLCVISGIINLVLPFKSELEFFE